MSNPAIEAMKKYGMIDISASHKRIVRFEIMRLWVEYAKKVEEELILGPEVSSGLSRFLDLAREGKKLSDEQKEERSNLHQKIAMWQIQYPDIFPNDEEIQREAEKKFGIEEKKLS